MTIWKFDLPTPDDIVELLMPRGAHVLSVQVQHNEPKIWAIVDPKMPMVVHKFRICGTGHPLFLAFDAAFVGTFQLAGGDLVFHLFDMGENP